MKYLPHFLAIALCIAALGCKKYSVPETTQVSDNKLENLTVPDNFTWVTTKDFAPEIIFEGSLSNQFLVVEVLDKKFNRIQKYFKPTTDGTIKLNKQISSISDTAYIFCSKANVFFPFPTTDNAIRVNADQSTESARKAFIGKTSNNGNFFKSACEAGSCDRTINVSSGSITIADKEEVCIVSDFTGTVTFEKSGILSICNGANVSLTNINYWDSKKEVEIKIAEGGRLVTTANQLNKNRKITNYGITEFTSDLTLNGSDLVNYGDFTVAGKLTLNSGATAQNLENAILTTGDKTTINDGFMANAGKTNVSGNFEINNKGELENYCTLIVSGDFKLNNDLANNAYVNVSGTTFFNDKKSEISFENGAIWHTLNLTFYGGKFSAGSGSGVGVIKVSGTSGLYGDISINEGFLDVCDANGIETDYMDASDKTSMKYCETTVETDECIALGTNEGPSDGDDDEDGVDDGDDDDDTDSDVAGSFFYPSSGYAFRSFEDLWPSKGDYDFNDMVLKYKIEFFTNSANKVTKAKAYITVNAIGAAIKNGIAIQFLEKTGSNYNRHSGSIYQSVDEASYIDENDASVVVFTNNVMDKIGPVNYKNDGEGPDGAPVTFVAEIIFANGSNLASGSIVPDIFIFRKDHRGHEVHLPGMPPSDAVDQSLFNTKDDSSRDNHWYKTEDNFPWGMEIHGSENFLHPLSKVSIIDAYEDFGSWVSSNGTNNLDWYNNPTIPLCY